MPRKISPCHTLSNVLGSDRRWACWRYGRLQYGSPEHSCRRYFIWGFGKIAPLNDTTRLCIPQGCGDVCGNDCVSFSSSELVSLSTPFLTPTHVHLYFVIQVCWQASYCPFTLPISSFQLVNFYKMGLGVLEDRQMAAPPGTSTLGTSAAAGRLTHSRKGSNND